MQARCTACPDLQQHPRALPHALQMQAASSGCFVIYKLLPRVPPSAPRCASSSSTRRQPNPERCGRLGGAVMRLPASMDSASVVGFLKSCGVRMPPATGGIGAGGGLHCAPLSVAAAFHARSQVRATAPRSPVKDVSHALQLMHELWVAGCRPSSRACAGVLRLCSPSDAAFVLQRMSLFCQAVVFMSAPCSCSCSV